MINMLSLLPGFFIVIKSKGAGVVSSQLSSTWTELQALLHY